MFKPLRRLQLKKYFFRICRFVLDSQINQLGVKKIFEQILKKVMSEILTMVLGTLLGGIVTGVINGMISIVETYFRKNKKWKNNRADAKSEYKFLESSLMPNIKLHLEYTKCNFYVYYYDFILNQLQAVKNTDEDSIEFEFDLIKSDENIVEGGPGNLENRNLRGIKNKFGGNHFGAKVKVLAQRLSKLKAGSKSKRTKDIGINTGVRDSIMVYLDTKCIRASTFCKSLIASGFLNNILTEEQLEGIKSKVFYYIYTGPISKVMKIEKAEGSYKISPDFLYKNHFFMHTVDYPMSESNDDRNTAFLYCRACSNFALADSINTTSLYKDILTDSTALDIDSDLIEKFSQEITSPEDNLDSISTYIRKIDIKASNLTDRFFDLFRNGPPRQSTSVKYMQIFALGYKYIGPSTDFSKNKAESEMEERKDEEIYNEFQRIYKFIPQISQAEFKISANLRFDSFVIPEMTQKSEFNFISNQWNFFPHDTRCDYSYTKTILPNKLHEQNFEESPLFGLMSIPADDIPAKSYLKLHGITRIKKESNGKFVFTASYDQEFIALDSSTTVSSEILKEGNSKIAIYSEEMFTPDTSTNTDCKINPNTDTSKALKKTTECLTKAIKKNLLIKICEDCDLNSDRFDTFRSFLDVFGLNPNLAMIKCNKNIAEPMETTITKLYGNDQDQKMISYLNVGGTPNEKLFDIHMMNSYPEFEEFQNNFLGHAYMEKNPPTDKSFVFAFHQHDIKDQNKEIKGKNLFNIDSITGGVLHGLFPVRINSEDKIVYFIRRLSDAGKPTVNILYDIKLQNTKDKDELEDLSNSISTDDADLSAEELEFAKMANAEVISSSSSNMDVKKFSNVPNTMLIYVEYLIDSDLKLDTHLSKLYDNKSILGTVLFDIGFIPVFPQYSPDDNLVDTPEDFENELANNPGNYFMVFWLQENFNTGFRFWMKKNYLHLDERNSIICEGYHKKRKMQSKKTVLKSKKVLPPSKK